MLHPEKKRQEQAKNDGDSDNSKRRRLLSFGSALLKGGDPGDLFGQTLRSIVLLVGSCVLFVGALSAAAVAITSKAMNGPSPSAVEIHDSNSPAPKKPLSI